MPRFSARKKNKDLMKLLLSTDSFQKEVKEFRTKFEIDEGGNRAKGKQWEWEARMVMGMPEYFPELNKLIRSYHLPEHFDRNVRIYIEQGFVSFPIDNFTITPSGFPTYSLKLNTYAKLSNKERQDAFDMMDRMGEHLPSVGTIKNLDELLKSERIYEDCEAYNKSELREYRATVKEYAESAEEVRSPKTLYEHKRMLDEHRKTKFGKM